MTRVERGIVGAVIALVIAIAFFAGWGLRPCLLTHRTWLTIEVVGFGYTFYGMPIVLAGFLAGYFTRVRLSHGALFLGTVVLSILSLVVGSRLAPIDNCGLI